VREKPELGGSRIYQQMKKQPQPCDNGRGQRITKWNHNSNAKRFDAHHKSILEAHRKTKGEHHRNRAARLRKNPSCSEIQAVSVCRPKRRKKKAKTGKWEQARPRGMKKTGGGEGGGGGGNGRQQ